MQNQILTGSSHEVLSYTDYKPLFTGIENFDNKNAITHSDFSIIAGGSGSGKSTISLFIACSIAKSGKKVVYFNAELEPSLIVKKIKQLGFNFDIDFGEYDSNDQHRLIIISSKIIKFEQIKNSIMIYKPDALFVDLFNSLLGDIPPNKIWELTRKYATELSFYPGKYNCAIFVTEQLKNDNKRFHRPGLNDIGGGASLYQKATKVIIAYRYYKEKVETILNKSVAGKNVDYEIIPKCTEILVKKDRFGVIDGNVVFIKYENGFGYQSLNAQEQSEYLSVAFGVAK